jgi:hypothetical protein
MPSVVDTERRRGRQFAPKMGRVELGAALAMCGEPRLRVSVVIRQGFTWTGDEDQRER